MRLTAPENFDDKATIERIDLTWTVQVDWSQPDSQV